MLRMTAGFIPVPSLDEALRVCWCYVYLAVGVGVGSLQAAQTRGSPQGLTKPIILQQRQAY